MSLGRPQNSFEFGLHIVLNVEFHLFFLMNEEEQGSYEKSLVTIKKFEKTGRPSKIFYTDLVQVFWNGYNELIWHSSNRE